MMSRCDANTAFCWTAVILFSDRSLSGEVRVRGSDRGERLRILDFSTTTLKYSISLINIVFH